MRQIFIKATKILTLNWMTGPILTKELRVSSRRKRFYLIRSLYLVLLMAMMAILWMAVTDMLSHSSVYIASRMAEASKMIVASITWFQFIAAQLIAVVIFSAAINAEIYNRTLYTLMTTPITSFQIIMGKLFSRLWQILLLLAVSFPLLAMLRVFGGIPWIFLVETFCITACTVLFVGSVTLFFSILFRRAYVVIIITVITLAIIFVLMPLFVVMLDEMHLIRGRTAETVITHINPHIMLAYQTDRMFGGGTRASLCWFVPCIILSASSVLVLWTACALVRKIALKHMTPKLTRKKYKMPPRKSKTYWLRRPFFLHSIIQRTIGTGMIWKEFLHPVLGKFRKIVFIGIILMIAAFIISVFSVLVFGNIYLFSAVVAGSVIGVIALAILFTIIIPATYITSEKETGTWLILLTTCYSDSQIIGGKIVGILRRIIIIWSPFFLIYYIASYIADYPAFIFFTLILTALMAIGFVTASGLYFSSRFKHSTTAVICNLSLVGILWAAIPGLLIMLEDFFHTISGPFEFIFNYADDFLRLYWPLTPPGLMEAISRYPKYRHSFQGWNYPVLLITYTIIHLFAILFFLWRTKANLRKRIS